MAKFNPRDRSRTTEGKTASLVKKHTNPPRDQGGWMALTLDMLESAAYRTLSPNGRKCWDRLTLEHVAHGGRENGRLIVTHEQFIDYGVTGEYVADGLDELAYKGLIKMQRGKAGNGTAHPTVFTLTFMGTYDGAPATNEWKRFTVAEAKLWSEVVRKQRADARAAKHKSRSSLRDSEVRHFGIAKSAGGF